MILPLLAKALFLIALAVEAAIPPILGAIEEPLPLENWSATSLITPINLNAKIQQAISVSICNPSKLAISLRAFKLFLSMALIYFKISPSFPLAEYPTIFIPTTNITPAKAKLKKVFINICTPFPV